MKYIVGLLKAAIFFTLFAFALNNQQTVTVHFFFGTSWTTVLVIVVLVAFVAGLASGILTMLPPWWKARQAARQASRAQTDGNVAQQVTAVESTTALPSAATSSVTVAHDDDIPGDIPASPAQGSTHHGA